MSLWTRSLTGFGDPGKPAYEWEQNMAMINMFGFFFFQLFILRSLFKPFVRREKSNKGEAVAGAGRLPGARLPLVIRSCLFLQSQSRFK